MCHNWRMMGFFFFLLPTGVEWVDVEHRKLVGVIDSLSWTFGNVVFAAIAYFINDWRLLIISVTAPLILSIAIWRYDSELLAAKCLKSCFFFTHFYKCTS